MDKCALVLGAGTGASNNLIRSLRAGDRTITVVGAHTDRFVLKKSPADRNCLLPALNGAALAGALRRLADPERTVLIPNYNMAALYLRLAFDEPLELRNAYETAEDVYLVRDLDTLPDIFHADDLFRGIDEADVDP